jgi:RNA polymerase sigma-70 factor, ECF subfamily
VDERPSVTETPLRRTDGPSDFEDFFASERVELFGAIVMVTRSTSEAEELVQEAFVRVWERWDQVCSHPDPHGYLYRTAFNLDRQRRRALRRAAARLTTAVPEPDPFERTDQLAELSAALGRLTRRQRTAIVLMDLLDIDSNEAGRLMGSRPGTVRSLASQGRAVLREALGGQHE